MAKVKLQEIDREEIAYSQFGLSISLLLTIYQQEKDVVCPEKFICNLSGRLDECFGEDYESCKFYHDGRNLLEALIL